jgi:hypothetical protein
VGGRAGEACGCVSGSRPSATFQYVDDERETEELAEAQRQREVREKDQARTAADEHEAAQHERRAEKARYLRKRLDERAQSERKR